MAPADACKAAQVGNDGATQHRQQRIEGLARPAASARNASMKSSRWRKLAVSSTWQSRSATPLRVLAAGRGCCPAPLQLGDRRLRLLGAAGSDVFKPAPGIFDQQEVDALPFETVVLTSSRPKRLRAMDGNSPRGSAPRRFLPPQALPALRGRRTRPRARRREPPAFTGMSSRVSRGTCRASARHNLLPAPKDDLRRVAVCVLCVAAGHAEKYALAFSIVCMGMAAFRTFPACIGRLHRHQPSTLPRGLVIELAAKLTLRRSGLASV